MKTENEVKILNFNLENTEYGSWSLLRAMHFCQGQPKAFLKDYKDSAKRTAS